MSGFQINAHAVKKTKTLTKRFEVDCVPFDDFYMEVSYVSKRTIQRWVERATKMVRNAVTKKREQRIDETKLFKLYAENVIVGWDGLDVGKLKQIVAMEGVGGIPDDQEVVCTEANVVALLQNALEIDSWLSNLCTDPLGFQADDEPEEDDADDADGGTDVPLDESQAAQLAEEAGN